MFTEILSEYFSNPQLLARDKKIFGTKSEYEFEMAALMVDGGWYVLVEHPDSSRLRDIDDVISGEFNANTKGWRVLNKYREELGSEIIDFLRGDQEYSAITYDNEQDYGWLLKIEPKEGSRLLG